MRFALFALIFSSVAVSAFAQKNEPIPPTVFDVRIVLPMLKQSAVTASSLGVTTEELAGRGLGLVGGLHFYPVRGTGFALGFGGEFMLAGATHQTTDAFGNPTAPEVDRRFRSLSGQISLNFGKRNGWSYISAGMGPVTFDTYLAKTLPDGLRPLTINYGGGARWFNYDHLAFSLDLRFYLTKPALATLVVGTRDRQTVMAISAGISIK
jgi:hypothetical protein